MNHKAFTLIELIIVIIVIGILASIALPQFGRMKEKALDNEAKANLKLIQAAQKIYRMEMGSYYGAPSSCSIPDINQDLKLSIPSGSNRNWNYCIYVSGNWGSWEATRNASPARTWVLLTTQEEPACTGTGCP